MKYWDSSALIPLLVHQPLSEQIHPILEQDSAMITWWSTPVEIFSGMCRLRREGVITDAQAAELRSRFTHLVAAVDLVLPSTAVRNRAIRLLPIHQLRAADALQLSAALHWCREVSDTREFVCLDDRLRRAAANEGFVVLPSPL